MSRTPQLLLLLAIAALFTIGVVKLFGGTVSTKFSNANMSVSADFVFEPPDPAAAVSFDKTPAEPAASDTPATRRVQHNLPQGGQMTAGAWSDNTDWDFWSDLMQRGYESHLRDWDLDVSRRFVVSVESGGDPVRNAAVDLYDAQGNRVWSAMTDGRGTAFLFANRLASGPFEVRVAGQRAHRIEVDEPLAVELPAAAVPTSKDAIEVMFVVDTTGSMADELWYLKGELAEVAARVHTSTRNEFALRIGTTVYRDHSDAYLVRTGPFTTDVQASVDFLAAQSADGGGDFPEAVDEALAAAIEQETWSPTARARLLFLVLDAPPHADQNGMQRLRRVIARAARDGIQVIPVVGSGIDKNTEFLMRALAIMTQGTYVFLTSHSGIGGAHIEPTTGDYDIEKLNDLIVRLIVEAAA